MQNYVSLGKTNISVTTLPPECPFCHRHIDAIYIWHLQVDEDAANSRLDSCFRCPSSQCDRLLLGFYKWNGHPEAHHKVYAFKWSSPFIHVPGKKPVEVCKVSPKFEEIFDQSIRSKNLKLDHVAGPGLRKAFEFLLKDFLAYMHPGEIQAIRQTRVGQLLTKYTTDLGIENVEVIRRISWLGNDQVHCDQIWTTKDLDDLAISISLLEDIVKIHIRREELVASMPKP